MEKAAERNNGRMNEKIFATPYGEIHYWIKSVDADSPWLIFLPGLTADHHLFDKQIDDLDGKYNCFTWDSPAHGLSRPFLLQFSLENIANYLHDILEKESIRMPLLIGQSFGGYISQMYVELFPDEVSGFISIDSCSLQRKYYSNWELALLKHTKWMYLSIPWKLLIKWGANGTATTEYGRHLMKQTMESYEKREYCELADHGYRIFAEAVEANRSYELKCSTLLLCGEKDAAGSAKDYNRRWKEQDGYTLIWLEGAGHNSNTDVPEKVNRIIEEFVSCCKG